MMLKFALVLGLGFVFLAPSSLPYNQTHAQVASAEKTENQIKKEQLISRNNFFQVLSSMAYVILWPLVALAGLAMDNQLIYGSFMQLDVSLWNIWQIVRSFANYALGLIFLIAILMYNLSPEKKIGFGSFVKGISNPVDLIKKTLIASLLIQASWFILMAAVDLSTVLTYTVGAIPTSLLATTDEQYKDVRMLGMNTMLNLGDEGLNKDKSIDKTIFSYRSTKKQEGDRLLDDKYLAPCKVINVKFGAQEQSFIIGRVFDQFTGWEAGKATLFVMEPNYCVHYGSLFSFSDFYSPELGAYAQSLVNFDKDIRSDANQIQPLINRGLILPLGQGKFSAITGVVEGQEAIQYGTGEGARIYKGQSNSSCKKLGFITPKPEAGNYECLFGETQLSLSNIIDKGKSMTGPFVALYSNVFNFADLKGYSELGTWQTFVVALINALFATLLVLPLLALVLVLFARVGVLWLAIALSPFIVLAQVFKDMVALPKQLDFLNPGELIKLLLAPVLVSFAVSLSLIFMTTLKGMLDTTPQLYEQGNQANTYLAGVSGLEVENGDLNLLGFIKIKFDNAMLNLSWIVIMIFGLAITWFLLFWAIKQTKIGASIGGGLQKFGESWLMTRPIIPVGANGISFSSLANAPNTLMTDFSTKLERTSDENLRKWLNPPLEPETKGTSETEFTDEKAKAYFSTGGSTFEKSFGTKYSDPSSSLGTLNSAVNYLQKEDFSENPGLKQQYEKRLVSEANSMRKALLEKGKNQNLDGEALTNLKKDFELLLQDKHIQSFKLIDERKKNDIVLGNKRYSITSDTANPQTYLLQEKS